MDETQDVTTEEQSVDTSAEVAPEGNAEAPSNPTDDTEQAAPEQSETGEELDPKDLVRDEETGEEWISKKAFEARIAKLTAQKHSAIDQFTETIASNPEAKQKFLDAIGVKPQEQADPVDQADPDSVPEVEALKEWVAQNVQPETQPHYKEMLERNFVATKARILADVQRLLKPVMAHIGDQTVKQFSASHPDYVKYQNEIKQMVSSGRARTLEDAYKLAAWEEKMKGAGAAALKQEKDRQARLASNPSKRLASTVGATQPKFDSMKDFMAYQAKRKGMQF